MKRGMMALGLALLLAALAGCGGGGGGSSGSSGSGSSSSGGASTGTCADNESASINGTTYTGSFGYFGPNTTACDPQISVAFSPSGSPGNTTYFLFSYNYQGTLDTPTHQLYFYINNNAAVGTYPLTPSTGYNTAYFTDGDSSGNQIVQCVYQTGSVIITAYGAVGGMITGTYAFSNTISGDVCSIGNTASGSFNVIRQADQ